MIIDTFDIISLASQASKLYKNEQDACIRIRRRYFTYSYFNVYYRVSNYTANCIDETIVSSSTVAVSSIQKLCVTFNHIKDDVMRIIS